MQSVMVVLGVLFATAGIAAADQSDRIRGIFEDLRQPDAIEILSQEGISNAMVLVDGLIPVDSYDAWRARVAELYDPVALEQEVFETFRAVLVGQDMTAAAEFYQSELGHRIVDLELEARIDMQDPAIEQLARGAVFSAMSNMPQRLRDVGVFIQTTNLIDRNVAYGLNDSMAFYMGLADGGALDPSWTPDVIRQTVWSEEPFIRSGTMEWMNAYLYRAYQPLSDEEMRIYLEFVQSPAGEVLNNAMYAAYDQAFVRINREMGRFAAELMLSSQL